MKRKIVLIASILIGANTFAQPALDWVNSIGVDPNIGGSEIRRIHTDVNDNISTVVLFDTDSYHPDPNNSFTTIAPFGYTSAIVNYNSLGQYQWSLPLYFTGNHSYQIEVTGITTDASGSTYICGYTAQEFDANPGPSINLITPYIVGNNYNMFVIKYSSSGTYVWSQMFQAMAGKMEIGPNGNLFITGRGATSSIDFDPGPSVVNGNSFGSEDAFLLELNTNGDYVDIVTFGGTANEGATNVDFDSNGNIYITGNYYKSGATDYSQFDPQGTGTQYSPFSTSVIDGFLLKLNSNKVFQWAKVFECQENYASVYMSDYERDNLHINSQNNIVLCVGSYLSAKMNLMSGTATPVGTGNISFTSFDSSGNPLNYAEIREDNQSFSVGSALADNDAIYFTTMYGSTIDIDPGTGVNTLNANSGYGSALAKLDINLNLYWAGNFDGGVYPCLNTNQSNELIVGFSNFSNNGLIDVDLSASTFNLDNTDGDVGLMKYYECLSIDETVINSSNVLTASQSGGVYQWVDCNNGNAPISGATSQSYTPTIAGDYACEITIGSCTYISDCSASTVGIKENIVGNAVNIYPNPSNGRIFIINDNNINIDYLEVLDVFGRILRTETINNTKSELNLEPGTYFLKLYTNNQKQSIQKVIITN